MAQIAGLSDMRGAGPPGDIGTFQMSCSVLVFQFTFSGTTYINAIRAGDRGWIPICPASTVFATVVQATIDYLDPLGGGELLLREGTYVSATQVIMNAGDNDLIISGCGEATKIISGANRVFTMSGVSHITIRDLYIQQIKNAGSSLDAIYMYQSQDITVENVTIEDPNNQSGITAEESSSIWVIRCHIVDAYLHGMLSYLSTWIWYIDNKVETYANTGICVIGVDQAFIVNNKVYDANGTIGSTGDGIAFQGCTHVLCSGNDVQDFTNLGIIGGSITASGVYDDLEYISIVNNTISNPAHIDASGIWFVAGNDKKHQFIICEGNIIKTVRHGIANSWAGTTTVFDNIQYVNNQISDTYYTGIYIQHVTCGIISDNLLVSNGTIAINLNNASGLDVQDNRIRDPGARANNTYDAIYLEGNSDNNKVEHNTIRDSVPNMRYAINLSAATCDGNTVQRNRMDAGATGRFNDAGTGTILESFSVPITNPQSGATEGILGILVDDVNERGAAYFTVPDEAQEIWAIEIWGIAAVTEVDAMNGQIVMSGGADNEPYNTHTLTDDVGTITTNFAANDLVRWRYGTGEVKNLRRGDAVMVYLRYSAADASNCATNVNLWALKVYII